MTWALVADLVGLCLLALVAALAGLGVGRRLFDRDDQGSAKLRTVLMCGFFALALYRVFVR